MTFIAGSLRDYKRSHNGSNPASYTEFHKYLKKQPDYSIADKDIAAGRVQFHFYEALDTKEFATYYLPYKHRPVILSVDRNGDLTMTRVWLWPRWNLLVRT